MERGKSNEKVVRNLSLESNSGMCFLFLSYALSVKSVTVVASLVYDERE